MVMSASLRFSSTRLNIQILHQHPCSGGVDTVAAGSVSDFGVHAKLDTHRNFKVGMSQAESEELVTSIHDDRPRPFLPLGQVAGSDYPKVRIARRFDHLDPVRHLVEESDVGGGLPPK